jgi:3-oxoacyl-[acyl-carrier protein] reductase
MHSVLVTGASRGLGLAIAKKIAGTGHRVIAVSRSKTSQLDSAISETAANGSGSIEFAAFDLANVEEIPAFTRKLRKEFGPIYGLVNNAGIGTDGVLAIMQDSQIRQLVNLNTLSPILLTKYVVRYMIADGGGRIVNISSIVGSTGYSGLSVYGATKASLLGFTRSLAREVGKMGVNVNAVAPGFVDTEMTQKMSDEERQRIVRRSALKRLTSVDDVANAVEFLLSEKANSVTGTVLTVDAGNTA